MAGIERIAAMARRGAEGVAAALFAALFLTFLVQISARWAFNKPLPWTDELAVLLYIWTVLWGCAVVVRWREHVAFDALMAVLPTGWARAASFVQALVLGGLCAWALPACLDYVQFMQRESTPVLGWSYRWVFMPFVLMLAAIVLRCSVQCLRALRP